MQSVAFKTILVGVNDTPESEHAVAVATSLARDLRAQLILLGVIPPLSPETEAEGVGLEDALKLPGALGQRLSQMASAARELNVTVATEVTRGDPEKEIERKAEEDSVDLIVVGHRDVSRVRRWLEGSTSETLVQASRVSILIVHDQPLR